MFASLRLATLACLGAYAVLAAAPRAASAQTLPGSAKIVFKRLLIHKDLSDNDLDPTTTDEEAMKAFNNARCKCSEAGAANSDFSYEIQLENRTTAVNIPGQVWTGPGCSTETTSNRPLVCKKVADIGDLDVLSTIPATPRVPVLDLVNPNGTACESIDSKPRLWLGADSNSDGNLDYWEGADIAVDTQAPPVLTGLSAKGGESAILVKWTLPTSRLEDIKYIQVLCAKLDGSPALSSPSNSARFQTGKSLCAIDDFVPMTAADGATEGLPDWAKQADARYVCGDTTAVTSLRVGGLANGEAYQVAVVTVDLAGNAAGVFIADAVTPAAVTDFWEDLHDRGSEVEGGFCLLARTYGDDSDLNAALRGFRDDTLRATAWGRALIDGYYEVSAKLAPLVHGGARRAVAMILLAPLVALALAWHLLGLPLCVGLLAAALLWRRRRLLPAMAQRWRAAALPGGVVLALVAWPRVGHAQTSLEPYWNDVQAPSDRAGQSRWHAGIRVGPYTPAIDAQFGSADPGPYERMFGGAAVLPMLDVDWILWEGLGQVAVGGSIGFMSKTARAFATGPDVTMDQRAADTNRFRMVPMAATVAFRLTHLDTRYHIPLIPYVRGGLAYYAWWVEAPDGGVASVCRAGGTTCDENKGRGGSLGVVGSLGLAVRAEQIDFESASAMRENGIQHAGFYAEVQASKIDDFGIGNKLAVGDITWFAGVDFEF